jgi:hypothetical protein
MTDREAKIIVRLQYGKSTIASFTEKKIRSMELGHSALIK